MTGRGAWARSRAKLEEKKKNWQPAGFTCRNCGHSEFIHNMIVGECLHNQMKPKDGSTCDCQKMK